MALCGEEELARLGSLLVGGAEMKEGASAEDAVSAVSGLLDCMDGCGSVVVQAVGELRRAVGSVGEDGPLGALEMLRSLSAERQGSVCGTEVTAAELVMRCLAPESGAEVGCGLRESGCMALFALGCRNGVAVCGTIEFLDVALGKIVRSGLQSLLGSVSTSMSADSVILAEVAAVAADGLRLLPERVVRVYASSCSAWPVGEADAGRNDFQLSYFETVRGGPNPPAVVSDDGAPSV